MAVIRSSLGRKAIFFTISSILIVSLFILYYSTRNDLSIKEKSEISEARVTVINDFVHNFERIYLPRALYATTNRALITMIDYMITKGVYLNVSRDFPEVLLNGSIYDYAGEDTDDDGLVDLPDMEDKTLSDWLNNLTQITRTEMNIYSEFNITDVRINQSKPWWVNVTVEVSYNISSPGVVSIVRRVPISAEVSIQGFTDPLIAIETDNRILRKINRFPLDVENTKDIDIIKELIEQESYVYNGFSAPSFLMRMEKNLSPSQCCGIESLITPNIIYEGGNYDPSIEIGHRSYVDYQFWTEDTDSLCQGWTDAGGFTQIQPDTRLYNISGISNDDAESQDDERYPFKLDEIHTSLVYSLRPKSNELDDQCSLGIT